jgi:hypothetical protein
MHQTKLMKHADFKLSLNFRQTSLAIKWRIKKVSRHVEEHQLKIHELLESFRVWMDV